MKVPVSFAAALCVAAAALCGCGQKKVVPTGATKRPLVTAMVIDYHGKPFTGDYAQEVFAKMTEYTNTDVEFTFASYDDYNARVELLLKTPELLPMIMHVNKFNMSVVDAANNDEFWDLNDFLWKKNGKKFKYPNLAQANKNVCENLSIVGRLFGLYKARDIGRYGLAYRTDWAEKLGLKKPESIEDVYNMLYAFTYGDPDGNGKDDTYGLSMCKYTGPFDIMQTWFGCGNDRVEENGTLVPVHDTAAYKEALLWLRKIYADGLIVPDWRNRETAAWKDQIRQGEAGVFIDCIDVASNLWDYFTTNGVPSVVDPSQTASMTLVGAVNGHTLATTGYNGFFVITKAAKTEAQVEACLHFLDKMCDNEMLLLGNYGLKDVHYIIDDGGFLIDTDIDNPASLNNYAQLNQAMCYIPRTYNDIQPYVKRSERKVQEITVIKENEAYAVFNPATPYLMDSLAYAMMGEKLDALLTEARNAYICGELDDAGLEKAFEDWDTLGGAGLRVEVNTKRQQKNR